MPACRGVPGIPRGGAPALPCRLCPAAVRLPNRRDDPQSAPEPTAPAAAPGSSDGPQVRPPLPATPRSCLALCGVPPATPCCPASAAAHTDVAMPARCQRHGHPMRCLPQDVWRFDDSPAPAKRRRAGSPEGAQGDVLLWPPWCTVLLPSRTP
eukprot:gene10163-biopygen7343